MRFSSEINPDVQAIDDLLAAVGMEHGRRRLMRAGYVPQARHPRQEGPEPQEKLRAVAAGLSTQHSELLRAAGIAHGFSTRTGGASTVYLEGAGEPEQQGELGGELNLGFTATDDRANVTENRARLLRGVFGRPMPLVTLHQVHSSITYRVVRADADRETPLKGDGLMTDEPGVVLGVQTADCVPVLVADTKRGAVAAFHAGWRGTLRRIVEGGVGRMRVEFGSEPKDLVAAIGPSIGPCCYAVGDEVDAEFRSQFFYAEELFCDVYDSDPVRKKYPMLFLSQRAPGHTEMGPSLHLDLAEANRRQLLDAGLAREAIEVSGHCTSCRTDLYFSHRASSGFAGRMMNVIAARPGA
jgi:YfiH family protein